jgi:hypothetical protein
VKTRDEQREGQSGQIEVGLADARGRSLLWALIFLGLGALAFWGLAGVGKVIAVILAVPGLRNLIALVRGLLHPPGRIKLTDETLTITPRLSAGREVAVPWSDVKHAYLLKRSVPWTRSGPILVIETERGRFSYPRDWFQVESDQRRIATVLARRLGHL